MKNQECNASKHTLIEPNNLCSQFVCSTICGLKYDAQNAKSPMMKTMPMRVNQTRSQMLFPKKNPKH
jgi:hypothetical protein